MNEEQLIQYLGLETKSKKALAKAEKEREEIEAARKEQRKGLWLLVTLVVITVSVWFAYWGLIDVSLDSADRGGWGDKFGGLNALFTGVAFGALVYSLYMQRKDLQSQRKQLKLQLEELELQRKELRLTRREIKQQAEEMRGQKEQLELQAKEMAMQREQNQIQQLNTIFFQLLESHERFIDSISEFTHRVESSTHKEVQGKEFFRVICSNINIIHKKEYPAKNGHYFERLNASKDYKHLVDEMRLYHLIYGSFKSQHKNIFNNFFRGLINYIGVISTFPLDTTSSPKKKYANELKRKYLRILRSKLSDAELILLAYEGMSTNGEQIAKYINKYRLLRYLDFDVSFAPSKEILAPYYDSHRKYWDIK